MKRFISRAVAVILTCVLAFGSAVCFAADGTESADAKKYYDYGTYVLLGDSVASGHNDLVYVDSEFKRVENSYVRRVCCRCSRSELCSDGLPRIQDDRYPLHA